jgi:hypothetical protein
MTKVAAKEFLHSVFIDGDEFHDSLVETLGCSPSHALDNGLGSLHGIVDFS